MKGKSIYLSQKEIRLVLEAIDALNIDYDHEHPEDESLDWLYAKLIRAMKPADTKEVAWDLIDQLNSD